MNVGHPLCPAPIIIPCWIVIPGCFGVATGARGAGPPYSDRDLS